MSRRSRSDCSTSSPAAGLHPGDPIERELLWAACMLHDIGMAVDYDDHHKHSRYLILNGGLPGFTPREVALIAQVARYHRKGMPTFGELAPLLGKGDEALLDRAAMLLRLAEDLERSRDQSVREVHVDVDGTTVRLELRPTATSASRAGPPSARRPVRARLRQALDVAERERPALPGAAVSPGRSSLVRSGRAERLRRRPPRPPRPPRLLELALVLAVAEDAEVARHAAVGLDRDAGQDLLALVEAEALEVEVRQPDAAGGVGRVLAVVGVDRDLERLEVLGDLRRVSHAHAVQFYRDAGPARYQRRQRRRSSGTSTRDAPRRAAPTPAIASSSGSRPGVDVALHRRV